MSLAALLVFYRVHWGVSSRAPWGSVVQPSYTIPPPTTVVGALARAAYSLGLLGGGEFVEEGGLVASGAARVVSEFGVRWATAAWLAPVVKVGVPIAYFSAPYRASYDAADTVLVKGLPPRQLFSLYELGYVVAPHATLAVLVLLDESRARDAARAALAVSRLGSKESFVDPLRAEVRRVGAAEARAPLRVPWLTPSECLEGVAGSYVLERTPVPYSPEEWLCWYSAHPCPFKSRLEVVREAVHPRFPGWCRGRVDAGRCAVLGLGEALEVLEAAPEASAPPPPEAMKSVVVPREVLPRGQLG